MAPLAQDGRRIAAVDFVKAVAIVAVAVTHSGVPPWAPVYSAWDFWLCGILVNFQVPAFLFVSGFLYRRAAPIPGRVMGRRLARVVVPFLVASAVAYALGFARARTAGELLFQLATASTLGIYYFVFLLAMFVPTIWVLSRLPERAVRGLCAALWLVAVATEVYAYVRIVDTTRPPTLEGLFWLARSPFNFNYAMFVSGWVAAAHAGRLADVAAHHRPAVLAASLAGIALFVAVAARWPWATPGGLRMLYTLSVVSLIAAVTRTWRVPALLRFLSTASLGLYLYHHMVQIPLQPAVRAWWPLARILTVAGAGLVGAGVLCRLGTAVLGRRARTVLGA